jgi:hypothetical protein
MSIDELKRFFPNASRSTIVRNKAGDTPLRADDQKSIEGDALVRPLPRKGKSRKGAVLGAARRHITFRIFSTRPADWDGYSIKELQDCLVRSGLLLSDDWDKLSGEIISEKVDKKEEEMTIVEIT